MINSIWSSDDDDPKLIAENVTSTPPAVAKVEPVETAPTQPDQFEPIDPAAAETPHAIKVEQTPSAAPAWPIPSPVPPQEQPRPSVETTWASANPAELLKATSAASIHNGPSASADVIGTAYAAARVQVAARDSGWTQIVDPSTGNRGWIDSALLAPLTPAVDTASTEEDSKPIFEEEAADAIESKPTASAKKHGSNRHHGRRGLAFRFGLMRFRW